MDDTEKLTYVLGGAAFGLAVGLFWPRKPSISAVAPTTPGNQLLAQGVSLMNGGLTITVAPGSFSQSLDVNTVVILYLPTGAKWVSMDGAPISDLTSPQAFVFNGPLTHSWVYTDSSGQTQTANWSFSVAPTVPTLSV
jgi:hypothetical protein